MAAPMSKRCQMMSRNQYGNGPAQCLCTVQIANRAGVILTSPGSSHTAVCCGHHRRMLWHGREVPDKDDYIWTQPGRGPYVCKPIQKPRTALFTDPDGGKVPINADTLVHMTDEIQYTTVIVTKNHDTQRLVVVEPLAEVRAMLLQARKEKDDV